MGRAQIMVALALGVALAGAGACGAIVDQPAGGDASGPLPVDATPAPDAQRACDRGDFNTIAAGRCYESFTSTGAPRTHALARIACTAIGSTLARIDSGGTNVVVQGAAALGDLWIDASDAAVEGTFEWSTAPTTPSFTNFRTGEPNNGGGTMGETNEDCVVLLGEAQGAASVGFWDDRPCERNVPYVCERAAPQ